MITSRAQCPHMNFGAKADIHRLTKEDGRVTGYIAEFTVTCTDCGTPFQFLGLNPGMDTRGATVSMDGREARIALAPEGQEMNPLERMVFSINAKRVS